MAGEGGISSGSGSSFIRIAGNVKQQFLPFVLKPDAKLHTGVESSTELKSGASPQIFTYKNYIQDFNSGCAKLNFYPSSMNSIAVNDDVAFKLLYGRKPKDKKSLTINDLLNSIPGIQIREFLPDTRLDQCINMFTDIMKNFASMTDDEKSKSNKEETAKEDKKSGLIQTIGKLAGAFFYTMKYMVGATDPDFFDDIGNFKGLPFSSYKEGVYKTNGKSPAPGYSVMAFPYVLYYRLQSCCTTNIYEIPAIDSGKQILQGLGTAGWTSGGDILSEGGFRVSKLLSKIPLIGDLANMALGNIGINYMPWWNAEAGSKTLEPRVEVTFDLFNDSSEAAMKNFIFVNTIVPNNRWIQYNMFQHSSNLYDVKIEGVNRLYACAGDFSVTYEGILRDPPEAWLNELTKKYLNNNLNKERFLANAKNYKLIKIPDIYRVKLSFQSLLPANFNNFIYNYAQNINHITEYSDKVYQQSVVSEILPTAVGRYVKRIVAYWNADEDGEKAANNAVSDSKKEYEI